MKTLFITLVTLIAVTFTSCDKFEFDDHDHDGNYGCGTTDYGDKGYWDKSDKPEGAVIDGKYVYEEIVYSDDCDCPVKGKVKFVENGQTVALLDYGNGQCDEFGLKTICIDGNCKDDDVTIVKIKLDCTKDSTKDFIVD